MNRRNSFKFTAALPLGIATPAIASSEFTYGTPIPVANPFVGKLIWQESLTDFVPRDMLAYVHKGEPVRVTTTFVLPPKEKLH